MVRFFKILNILIVENSIIADTKKQAPKRTDLTLLIDISTLQCCGRGLYGNDPVEKNCLISICLFMFEKRLPNRMENISSSIPPKIKKGEA